MRSFLGNPIPLPGAPRETEKISLVDVVFHLGRERRWGGWGNTEWTVLHHTLYSALLWVRFGFGVEHVFHALVHDAHEAFVGDMPSPIKGVLRELQFGPGGTPCTWPPAFDALATFFDEKILDALGLGGTLDPVNKMTADGVTPIYLAAKLVDSAALLVEAFYFGPPLSLQDVVERMHMDPPRLTRLLTLLAPIEPMVVATVNKIRERKLTETFE